MSERISQQKLEAYLWGAATLLRGTIDAGDYKQFIFPLLFWKRLCDVFDEETRTALEESGGNEEFAAYPENHRFMIPAEAHWRELRQVPRDVGRAIQTGLHTIETENPQQLFGIFGDAQWTNKDRLSDAMLRDLVEHFSTLELTIENLPEDELGNGYEYLIKKFADDSGHTAAEFYTNRTVVHLMTELLEPQPGDSIYDPTCGSGGMLLSAITHLKRRGLEWRNVHLYGQERNLMTSGIARMNLFLHGVEDFRIERGDTLSEPRFVEGGKLQRFDVVLANPPYSINQWDRDAFTSDPWGRNLYGTPPQGRADYAFWQHILQSMKPDDGRCAILFPHGVLFRQEEAEMRRKLIESDLIECVIGLGPNLFYNSPMEACVVICCATKPRNRRRRVLLINAVGEVSRERAQSFLTDAHVAHITEAYRAFTEEPGFAHVATFEEIRTREGNLSIPLYVTSVGDASGDGAPQRDGIEDALVSWLDTRDTARAAVAVMLGDDAPLGRTYATVVPGRRALFDTSSWPMVRFGDFSQNVAERVEPREAAGAAYIGLEHIDSEDLHVRRCGVASDVIGTKLAFQRGDIIFGRRRAYQRKLAVAEFDGICSAHAMVVRARPEKVLPEFLPFLMMSDRFMSRAVEISVGSLSPTVNWTALQGEQFALPSFDQQRRIAELLWATDEVIEDSLRVLKSARDTRLSYLRSVFFGGTANIQRRQIRDTGFVQLGRQRAPKYDSGANPCPYLRVANVFDGRIDYSDVLSMNFDRQDFAKYRLDPGDILLNEGQSRELVGRSAIYDGRIQNCCFQNTLLRYKAGPDVDTSFAFMYFQYCFHAGIFAAIASQTTSIAHLGAERFGRLEIPVPPLQDQRRIVSENERLHAIELAAAAASESVVSLRRHLIAGFAE